MTAFGLGRDSAFDCWLVSTAFRVEDDEPVVSSAMCRRSYKV